MADSRGKSAFCRASNSPMFAPVATGCCYRLGGPSYEFARCFRAESEAKKWRTRRCLRPEGFERRGPPHEGHTTPSCQKVVGASWLAVAKTTEPGQDN
jgi:hypothetical protein